MRRPNMHLASIVVDGSHTVVEPGSDRSVHRHTVAKAAGQDAASHWCGNIVFSWPLTAETGEPCSGRRALSCRQSLVNLPTDQTGTSAGAGACTGALVPKARGT